MPLPRYIPGGGLKKKAAESRALPAAKPKASLNDLDDFCLSKIIGHVLLLASQPRDPESLLARDNVRAERSLSLVSRRWYLLTQMQVAEFGVCRIDLDRIIKGRSLFNGPRVIQANNSKLTFTPRTPGVLMQRNEAQQRSTFGTPAVKRFRAQQQVGGQLVDENNTLNSLLSYNIGLVRKLWPLLQKYKHLIIEGTIKCDEFYKLLMAINAAKTNKLQLNLKIERDGTLSKDFAVMPKQMEHLEGLTLIWTNNVDYMFGNILTWTVFMRALRLACLQILLNQSEQESAIDNEKVNYIEKVAYTFITRIPDCRHFQLKRLIFNRSSAQSCELVSSPSTSGEPLPSSCRYSLFVKDIFAMERNLNQVETNDNSLIEHLIKSSDRIATTNQLEHLKFSSIIKSDLLLKILSSRNLGSRYLSVMIDNLNQLEEIKQAMFNFRQIRHSLAICQICLYLKDQKFSDCEDKIKNLIQLSKMAELLVYISVSQRVTIDCCHLMWSVGRALQTSSNAVGLVTTSSSSSMNGEAGAGSSSAPQSGRCIFKILLQAGSAKTPTTSAGYSEITVPFGKFNGYKVNSNREDMVRHREILKALKKDCYHQFVKSVRESV